MALLTLKEYFHAAQLCPLIYWCNADYVAWWKDIEKPASKYLIQASIGERKIPDPIKDEVDLDPITLFTLDMLLIVNLNAEGLTLDLNSGWEWE